MTASETLARARPLRATSGGRATALLAALALTLVGVAVASAQPASAQPASAQQDGSCTPMLVTHTPDASTGEERAVAITAQALDRDAGPVWINVAWEVADGVELTAVSVTGAEGTVRTITEPGPTGTETDVSSLVFCGTVDPALFPPLEPEPDEPAAPVEPEEPAAPTEPDETATPAEPEEPVTPAEPEEPVTPAEAEEPVTPAEPEEPAVPTEPDEPATPVEPEEPAASAEPADPDPSPAPDTNAQPPAGDAGTETTLSSSDGTATTADGDGDPGGSDDGAGTAVSDEPPEVEAAETREADPAGGDEPRVEADPADDADIDATDAGATEDVEVLGVQLSRDDEPAGSNGTAALLGVLLAVLGIAAVGTGVTLWRRFPTR